MTDMWRFGWVIVGMALGGLWLSPTDLAADGGGGALSGAGLSAEKLEQSSWFAEVRDRIQQEEYHVTYQTEAATPGYQAPNRAQGLRICFRPERIVVLPRGEEAPSWQLGLTLQGYGREGRRETLRAPMLRVQGPKIAYDRGPLEEWYVNRPEGLEQGFTIARRPPGNGALVVEMALKGGWRGRLSSDGEHVQLQDENGRTQLHYGKLKVQDAQDRELAASLSAVGDRLRIEVQDADARYPIVVDPLLTTASWTAEGDQAGAWFGFSVATAGDVNGDGYSDVIVGAPLYDNGQIAEGRAFVYHGAASGLSASANWTAEGNQIAASFGRSVSTAGDVNGDGYWDVIIGAYYYDGGQTDEGQALVYYGSASGLGTSPDWTDEGNQAEAYFGYSVSTAGDVNGDGYSDVIVGAYYYDGSLTDGGRALVYHGSASGPSATPDWTVDGAQAFALFAISVSSAGDVNGDGYADVVVGAPLYTNGQIGEGKAFVYHGSASGLSTTPAWTTEADQAGANYGWSVSAAGDVNGDGYAEVIVGARYYSNGHSSEGRAFVYHGSASGLNSSANWTTEGDQDGADFGFFVSTAGDVNGDGYADVIIGAPGYANGQTNEGRTFVYQGSSSGLGASAIWTAESNQDNAFLGYSVSTAGDVDGDGYSDVVVGSHMYDNGQTNEGRAFAYHGSPAGLSTSAGWTAESGQNEAWFGYSVSTAGDVNGDGYADVIIGAYAYDGGQTNEGRAFVYHGAASGLGTSAAWTTESNQAGALFGWSVSTAGDVNGDGYSDVVIGACQYDNGQTEEGRAFVYHGSASGLNAAAAWTAESDQALAHFGFSVSTVGDVNGDGRAEVIVGAPAYSNGQAAEGRAWVYHGSSSGLSSSAAWTAESNQVGAQLGFSVRTAGDVNGDGYSDAIVGAPSYSSGQTGEGGAFVYHGSSAGLSGSANWTAEGNQIGAALGWSVATAGDVNGDGYSEVVVGAPGYGNGQLGEGRAFVYHGAASGLNASASWTAESDQAGAAFGHCVAAAGDVNGDGYSDVIVGARYYDDGQTDEGGAFVYHGSSSGLDASAAWTGQSDQTEAWFGFSVATAGDVNGDGYSDVLVGAYAYDNGVTDEGRAFLYYGNAGLGLAVRPRQLRSNATTPIDHLGVSDQHNCFYVAALGRSPMGRDRLKLEWEAKLLGTALNGSGTSAGASFQDTQTGGYSFSEKVDGLTESKAYHWRARFRYRPGNLMGLVASRWFSPFPNGWQEQDLKTGASPLAVDLLYFTASASADRVLLEWETATELDNAGFRIWRSPSRGEGYVVITEALIPARGGPTGGAYYSYEDRDVASGRTYYYKLEDVDYDGVRTLHGPVSVAVVGRRGIVPLSPDGVVLPPKPPATFDWESAGFDRFQLQFSTSPDFARRVVSVPQKRRRDRTRWIAENTYTPSRREWKSVRRLGRGGRTVYWRVYGENRRGRGFTSDAKQFEIER